MSRWRLAARLARRELRRHWVRSALVVAIIALPVLAAQAGAIIWRSVELTGRPASGVTIVEPQVAGADERTGFDPRLDRPPPVAGAERVEVGFQIQDWTPARPGRGEGPDDLLQVHVVGFVPDASDVDLDEGRLPATRDEVVLSHDLAREADLGLGDRLEVIASDVELEVVGLSRSFTSLGPTAWAGPVAGGDDWVVEALPRLRDSGSPLVIAEMYDLYWLPAGQGPSNRDMATTWTSDAGIHESEDLSVDQVVGGAAGAAIAVGFVATVCSAAFAIGARRQLRTLGTLAAAGATPADLARAVLLQGTGLGLAGGAVATVLVYAGRAVVVERLADRSGWSIPWVPHLVLGVVALGVVAGTVASLVPALTASRIPTLSALAGRRPVRRRPLRSPWAGVALLAVGLPLLGWSTASRAGDTTSRSAAAAIAVLMVMAGLVALSPGVVAGVARLCARAPGTVRLAGRSLARDGMRSAAVVAATAVAVAIPVVLLVWAGQDVGRGGPPPDVAAYFQRLSEAQETVGQVNVTGAGDTVDAEDLDAVVREVGPDAVVSRTVLVTTSRGVRMAAVVDPEQLRRATGDDVVADALAAGAVVTFEPERGDPYVDGVEGVVLTDREVRFVDPADASDLALVLTYEAEDLVSEEVAAGATGDGVQTVSRPTPFTEAEAQRIAALATDDGRGYRPSYAALRDLRPPDPGTGVYVDTIYDDRGAEPPIELLVFLGSVLVALAVIGVASALAGADGRPDELVVAAVGAPPAVVRRRRVLEATFTAAAATVLGGGLGAVATLVVIHNPLVPEPGVDPAFRFPVLDVAGVGVGTVVVVGAATWLALAVGARVRGRRDLFLADG